ncbi:hypothetical protein QQF64_026074 [Cirrhinus molitorella]|uniref:CCHC-type domain-containing protein n=1 Tax=Cirrhinus molitorella TaxID=172907 RepID=A0ABR3NQV1_9TELE
MWIRMFRNLLVVGATGDAWPEVRKRAFLLHCLGTEGRDFTTLSTHFTPAINVVVERHNFRKWVQGAHESRVNYITALRQLAATCDFPNTEDMIQDQLIEHVSDPRNRERLLLRPNLPLAESITTATQVESASEQAKAIEERRIPVQAINIHQKAHHHKEQRTMSTEKTTPKPHAPAVHTRSCFHCGSSGNLANAKECPGTRAVCKNCKKKGHFAYACHSTPIQTVKKVLPEYTLLLIPESSTLNKIHCPVGIQMPKSFATVELTVDTGASVSVLPRSVYEANFTDTHLQPASARLVTY